MKYSIVRCLCWKGDTLSQSINNPRCQENAGDFDDETKAKNWLKHLESDESERLEREKIADTWNGNQFVFWIDKLEVKQ
jgi:hypothetical protein